MNQQLVVPVLIICILFANVCAATDKSVAHVVVHVRDELGSCISGAVVGLSSYSHSEAGEGFGRDVYDVVKGVTDSNGFVTLSASSGLGQMRVRLIGDMPGYYSDNERLLVFTNSSSGKWLPWNQVVDVTVKKVGKQKALFAKRFGGGKAEMLPVKGAPIGFDLTCGDWVVPFGRGSSSDLVVRLDVKLGGKTTNRYQIHDSKLSVSFSNDGDGIQSVYAQPEQWKGMRLGRFAPSLGYESNLVKHAYQHEGARGSDDREDQNYYFRIRSQKDADGNVTNALYGKIHGDIEWSWDGRIRFAYYLNPTPNDRNLEFDPKQNLFKNLSTTEQVFSP